MWGEKKKEKKNTRNKKGLGEEKYNSKWDIPTSLIQKKTAINFFCREQKESALVSFGNFRVNCGGRLARPTFCPPPPTCRHPFFFLLSPFFFFNSLLLPLERRLLLFSVFIFVNQKKKKRKRISFLDEGNIFF